MQLYEKDLFQLDDDIDNYLPFKVRNPFYPGTPITFRMLLAHTSSISDNSAILDTMYSFGMDHPMPLDTFLVNYLTPGGRLYDPEMSFSNFEPGSQWEYSNYAIALCGYLVQAITSVPFDAYCNVNIFQPLEMTNTAWFMKNLDTTLIARPYQYYNGQYIDYGLYGYPDYPDGQLRTTVASLGNFLLANIDNGAFHGKTSWIVPRSR
jgi:CubicO group peptidase (beta-lactamase class C family)